MFIRVAMRQQFSSDDICEQFSSDDICGFQTKFRGLRWQVLHRLSTNIIPTLHTCVHVRACVFITHTHTHIHIHRPIHT